MELNAAPHIGGLINKNVKVGGTRTTMRLEPEFWDALAEIARREATDINRIVTRVDISLGAGGRTTAVRVFVLQYFRTRLEAAA